MTRARAASVLAVAVLAAACSSGSSKAKEVSPTKAAGTAAAQAINLTTADLPATWSSEPADNSDNSSDASDTKIATCLGLPAGDAKPGIDIDLSSDTFSSGQGAQVTRVSSEVEITDTLAQAQRLHKAFVGDKAPGCFKQLVADQFTGDDTPGVTYGTPTVSKGAAPSGVDRGFAFDITIPFTAKGTAYALKVSILGFFFKHTEVTLQSMVLGTPASGFDQKALLDKLVERAKASAV
jgi:hypothetical protein